MSADSRLIGPVQRVGIVAKTRLREAAGLLVELSQWLDAHTVTVVFETATAELAGLSDRPTCGRDELPGAVDMVLVLGGDGTLIGMADRIAHAGTDIPMLGVNFGGLGFLTEITLGELYPSLESALAGTAKLDHHRMLRGIVRRGDQAVADRFVLNDVVVTKSATSSTIELSVSVGSQFVSEFKADGLIVASPTGSTAYNLAAGGPILHPLVDALVVTPIAPHTLTNRPIVIPAASEVRIRPVLTRAHDQAVATFDGQFGVELCRDDTVSVLAAATPLKLVRATTRSYFAVLREKLKWGER